jgi:hypothetical protein
VGQANLPAEQRILLDGEDEPATQTSAYHPSDSSSTPKKEG